MQRLTLILAVNLAFAAVACGGDDSEQGSDAATDVSIDAQPDAGDDVVEDTTDDATDDAVEDTDATEDGTDDATSDADTDEDVVEGPPVDQCVGRADGFVLVHGAVEAQIVAAECADECIDDESPAECAVQCTAADAGLSEGCAGCMVEVLECAAAACATDCEDWSSDECGACALAECGERRDACIGDLAAVADPATLNLVNARSDGGDVDVWVVQLATPVATDLPPGAGTTVLVPPGGSDDDVIFRAAGTGSDGAELARATFEFGYGPQSVQTIGLVGAEETLTAVGIREDPSSPPEGVRFRIVNGAWDGVVQVWDLSTDPGVWFILDLDFGTATADNSRAAGPLVLGVDDNSDESVDVVFDVGTVLADSQHTFWLTRDGDGPYVFDSTFDGLFTRFEPTVR